MATFVKIVKKTARDFLEDDCMSSAAAMAYYAIFSLPPILVLVVSIAGYFGVSEKRIQEVVQAQMGAESAAMDSTPPSENSDRQDDSQQTSDQPPGGVSVAWRIGGAVLLILSATGLFAQLQFSLNRAWEVKPDPKSGGILAYIFKRVLSLGMIVVVAFLLLVSMVLTTIIDEIIAWLQGGSATWVAMSAGVVLNNLVTFCVATLLFAAMFKVLPDAKTAWIDLWVGAAMTALLFVVGKAAIGWYVQRSDLGSNWGSAAASLIGVLVWMYYSSLIVLFGAELTQAWAKEHGRGIQPDRGAIDLREEK